MSLTLNSHIEKCSNYNLDYNQIEGIIQVMCDLESDSSIVIHSQEL
jgi:hypothetical protein